MDPKKLSYKEIKARQKHDLNSGTSEYYFYRYASNPFTWIFVKFGISPNTITISSFFLCILGFYFLSLGSYLYIIIGLISFLFFKIMDMSDGEVARIQNKKSVEGVYFDRISHYIFTCCFGLGLGFGLYRLYQNNIYIMLGFLFTFVFIMENALVDLLKSSLRKNLMRIDKKKFFNRDMKNLDKTLFQKLMRNIYGGRSWAKTNILSKLARIYPFQGIIYTDTFITPLLIGLTTIEYFAVAYLGYPVIDGFQIGIIPIYLLLVSISKSIWITMFIYKMEKNRYITNFLKEEQHKN